MRSTLPAKLEDGRITVGQFGSKKEHGPFGFFLVQGPCGARLKIVASGALGKADEGWEHVSISTERRPPNWEEMCFVKNLFWEPEECVVQFHPPASSYVNNHPHCLHLWRHTSIAFPTPPAILVGVKDAGLLTLETARQLRERMLREGG